MVSKEAAALLRQIPQLEKLLASPGCQKLLREYPRSLVTLILRETLEGKRNQLLTANG